MQVFCTSRTSKKFSFIHSISASFRDLVLSLGALPALLQVSQVTTCKLKQLSIHIKNLTTLHTRFNFFRSHLRSHLAYRQFEMPLGLCQTCVEVRTVKPVFFFWLSLRMHTYVYVFWEKIPVTIYYCYREAGAKLRDSYACAAATGASALRFWYGNRSGPFYSRRSRYFTPF